VALSVNNQQLVKREPPLSLFLDPYYRDPGDGDRLAVENLSIEKINQNVLGSSLNRL
jgi:hypothetical protein